jgi:hypothetical protein
MASAANKSKFRSARAGLAVPHYRPKDYALCYIEFSVEEGLQSLRTRDKGRTQHSPTIGVGLSARSTPLEGIVGSLPLSIGLSSTGHLVCGGQWTALNTASLHGGSTVNCSFSINNTVGILVRWLDSVPMLDEFDGTSFEALQLTFSIDGRVVGVSGAFLLPRGTELYPTVSLCTEDRPTRVMGNFSSSDIHNCLRKNMLVIANGTTASYLSGTLSYAVFALDGTVLLSFGQQ